MTQNSFKIERPARIPHFINGVLYSPEQINAMPEDHDFGPNLDFIEGLTGSTPVQNLTKEQVEALAKQHGLIGGAEPVDPDDMTVAQLRAELVAADEEPAANAKKDELADAVKALRAKA